MTYANQISHMLGDMERALIIEALEFRRNNLAESISSDNVSDMLSRAQKIIDIQQAITTIQDTRANAWKKKDKMCPVCGQERTIKPEV